MSENVKIGIQLTGVQQTENSIRGVNAQLEKTAALLSKISGRNISGIDAGVGEVAFNQMRRISSGLRGYNGLADFLDSPAATLRDSTARGRAYRDNVLRSLFSTSEDALRERGPGWRVEHPRGGFVAGAAHGAAKQFGLGKIGDLMKAKSLAEAGEGGGMMGAFKGGAAFGTGMVVAQAAIQAVSKAAKIFLVPALDTAKSIDTLKRRTGDLGGSFATLMRQVNKAADGLGVSYQEAAKLAVAQTRVSGNFHGGDLRSAIGFARATGMDIGSAVDIFGTYRRMGDIGSGEGQMKRFAYLVGQAVQASGYSGQAEAITKALGAYMTGSSRFGLSTPNAGAYLGAFAGLTRTGIPGLDPEGVAAMLGRADSAVRAGGGGRWGSAFLFQALGQGLGDPYATQAVFQQGLFGSSYGAFSGPWAQMVEQFGGRVPAGTLATNFSKIRAAFGRVMAGTGSAAPAAFAQLLGLQSAAQGAALYELSPATFDNLMNSAQRYGVGLKNISATGMLDFGRVTQARGIAGLLTVRNQLLGRGDLSSGDQKYLSGLSGSMGESALRQALGKFALSREMEDTPVTIMRRWSADMQNTITELGEKLLSPLNGILNAVNHLAGFDSILHNGYLSSGNGAALAGADPAGKAALSAALKKFGGGGAFNALAMAIAGQESGFNPGAVNGASSAAGPFQFLKGTWAQFGAGGFRGSWNDNLAALAAEMHAADYKAMHEKHRHTTTVEELMAHRYGLGAMFNTPTPGVLGEAARVDHYLHVEIKQGGATVAKKSLPLTAGAPIVPAGGGTIVAPGP